MTLPPLLLTGGPAAGKSTTARRLAESVPRSAFIDVDDVRQLVKNGGAAPWDGSEGLAQQELGVRNAAALTLNFGAARLNVTIADVVTPETLRLYRELIPEVLVIKLVITFAEAKRRASLRPVFLTDDEFAELHRQQSTDLGVDHAVDVSDMDLQHQVDVVRRLWQQAGQSATTPPGRP